MLLPLGRGDCSRVIILAVLALVLAAFVGSLLAFLSGFAVWIPVQVLLGAAVCGCCVVLAKRRSRPKFSDYYYNDDGLGAVELPLTSRENSLFVFSQV
jgi:hypothetical protein